MNNTLASPTEPAPTMFKTPATNTATAFALEAIHHGCGPTTCSTTDVKAAEEPEKGMCTRACVGDACSNDRDKKLQQSAAPCHKCHLTGYGHTIALKFIFCLFHLFNA